MHETKLQRFGFNELYCAIWRAKFLKSQHSIQFFTMAVTNIYFSVILGFLKGCDFICISLQKTFLKCGDFTEFFHGKLKMLKIIAQLHT